MLAGMLGGWEIMLIVEVPGAAAFLQPVLGACKEGFPVQLLSATNSA
jgi:hypothetical protein